MSEKPANEYLNTEQSAPSDSARGLATPDHQGRRVSMLLLRDLSLRTQSASAIPHDAWERIQRRLGRRGRFTALEKSMGCMATVMASFAILLLGVLIAPRTTSRWEGLLVIAGVSCAVGLMFWKLEAQLKQTKCALLAVESFLAERRCPSCGYDMAGLEIQPDGCTICPECGAAWRLPGEPDAG